MIKALEAGVQISRIAFYTSAAGVTVVCIAFFIKNIY